MDLRTIEDRLKTMTCYTSVQSVVDDFQLIVDNCETYNGVDNGWYTSVTLVNM